MKFIIENLVTLTSWLENYMSWYVIIIFFLCAHQAVDWLTHLLVKKEAAKRQRILYELDEVKDFLQGDSASPGTVRAHKGIMDRLAQLARLQQGLTPEQMADLNEKGTRIIKEHKAKPYLFFSGFVAKSLIFLFVLYYFSVLDVLTFHPLFPISAVILTFITNVSKKNLVFYAILCGLLLWVYFQFNGMMVVFIFYLAVVTSGKRWYRRIQMSRQKKQMQKNV